LILGLIVWLGAIGTVIGEGQREGVVWLKPDAAPAPPAKANSPVPAAPQAETRVDKSEATPGQSYVGEARCLECHDDQRQGYFGSPHHLTDDPRTPAAKQGCESCHGPGSRHVEDPASNHMNVFSQMSPEATSAVCTTCHNRGDHALWDGSQHDARELTCTTCHSVHAFKSETGQLKSQTQFGVCAQCHRDKIAKVDRSGHMPVREGKMACSTCHNPHGSTNTRLLRIGDSIGETCTSCHADKRGPYLWEHAPVRDGCTTCHDPHGSMNERMLVSKPPILCQRCHVLTRHPATIYDAALIGSGTNPSVRIFARSCVTCHSAVHGSNHPSGQRFTR
jgi:DmsE family decaheme c-type cytochrome